MNYELLYFATMYKFDALAFSPSEDERNAAQFLQHCHECGPRNSAPLLLVI